MAQSYESQFEDFAVFTKSTGSGVLAEAMRIARERVETTLGIPQELYVSVQGRRFTCCDRVGNLVRIMDLVLIGKEYLKPVSRVFTTATQEENYRAAMAIWESIPDGQSGVFVVTDLSKATEAVIIARPINNLRIYVKVSPEMMSLYKRGPWLPDVVQPEVMRSSSEQLAAIKAGAR